MPAYTGETALSEPEYVQFILAKHFIFNARTVMLYTTPKSLYISDITTSTKVGEDLSAEFSFDVEYHLENQEKEDVQCNIQLLDGAEDRVVAESFSCRDTRRLAAPKLWWPHLMSEQPGHMYQLRVSVISVKHGMDEYSLGVGLRKTCQRC